MLIGLSVLIISVVLSTVIGLRLGAGMRRAADEAMQVEYLSRWSDLKRLRKQG